MFDINTYQTGSLDQVLKAIELELPPLSDEKRAELALELYKSLILQQGLKNIADAIASGTSTNRP